MRLIFLTAVLSSLLFPSNAEARRKKAGEIDTSSVESAVPQDEVLSQAKTFLSKNKPEKALEILTSFLEEQEREVLIALLDRVSQAILRKNLQQV